jgi:hypothetical protein
MKQKIKYVPLDLKLIKDPSPIPKRKTRMCKFLKTCKKGDQCLFAHSEKDIYIPKCKFGSNCNKKNICKFDHTTQEDEKKNIIPIPQQPPPTTLDFPELCKAEYHAALQYDKIKIFTEDSFIDASNLKNAIHQYRKKISNVYVFRF